MKYTIDPSADEPIMLINQHIGFDEDDGMGVDSSLFQRELLQIDNMGKKRIQVWINCPGGLVYDTYNICASILKSKTPVDTYNMGIAASCGGVIWMCGRKRYMFDTSLFMMHLPSGGSSNTAVDAITGSLVTMLAAKARCGETEVRKMMESTTWLKSSECFKKGFCTDIESTSTSNHDVDIPQTTERTKARWKECNLVLNNILKPQNTSAMSFTKVTMKLNLVDGASEDSIIDSIKKIEDRAYNAETKVIQLENQYARDVKDVKDNAKKEVDAATQKAEVAEASRVEAETGLTKIKDSLTAKEKDFSTIKDKYDAMETEKNNAIAAEKKTKAETMVNGYVKTGRIKDNKDDSSKKAIDKYVALAIEDFDGTKAMIESIPVTGKAPVIMDAPKLEDGVIGTTAMALAVKNKLKREGKSLAAF